MWALLLVAVQTANPHGSPKDVDEGREVFRLRCAECHGAAGEGGRAPNLADGVLYAAPIAYLVNGKQYVSMSSGSALFTFALALE